MRNNFLSRLHSARDINVSRHLTRGIMSNDKDLDEKKNRYQLLEFNDDKYNSKISVSPEKKRIRVINQNEVYNHDEWIFVDW